MAKVRTPAVAYLRTSSAANVGVDRDSERRQRAAIKAYAGRAGFEIADLDWFYDAAVSGADPIEGRAGFAALLDRIEGNGIRTVIVEDASRFARDLVVQELGIALLARRSVRLVTASGDDLTDSDDLGRKTMRQVAGAFMEYEKGRLVAKLHGARERKRKETGNKVGGRKSHAELWPEVVAEARRLRRGKGKGGVLSYREISARLKDAGYLNERGQPFNPQKRPRHDRGTTAAAAPGKRYRLSLLRPLLSALRQEAATMPARRPGHWSDREQNRSRGSLRQ